MRLLKIFLSSYRPRFFNTSNVLTIPTKTGSKLNPSLLGSILIVTRVIILDQAGVYHIKTKSAYRDVYPNDNHIHDTYYSSRSLKD